jgi:orotate phosphoribosyltransferase
MMIKNLLLKYNAIEFGDFTLSSGQKSNYYVDVKTALTHPELLDVVARAILSMKKFDMVAGVAVGGIPLAVAMSTISTKPYVIIRKEKKEHGKSSLIIGDDVKNKEVLLVEDVFTTGSSALYGIKVLRDRGAIVNTVIAVVDREQGVNDTLKDSGVNIRCLVKISEVL